MREFSLYPETGQGGKTYYALTFGGLVALYATDTWRFISLECGMRQVSGTGGRT